MFRPLPRWQTVPCPALEVRGSCAITHCLFSHNLPPPAPAVLVPSTPTTLSADPPSREAAEDFFKNASAGKDPKPPSEDPRLRRIVDGSLGHGSSGEEKRENKRRKLSDDENSVSSSSTGNSGVSLVNSPTPTNMGTKTNVATVCSAATGPKSILKRYATATRKVPPSPPQATSDQPVPSAPKGIAKASLPPVTSVSKASTTPQTGAPSTKHEKPLTLNPRLVPIAPAKHGIRLQLLTLLHKEYVRLHEGKGDPQEMLRLALDEEEKVAREMRVIYIQAMKKRIVKFQKTSVTDYQKELEEKRKQAGKKEAERKGTTTALGIALGNDMDNSKPPLVTGLSPAEELATLSSLLQPWEALGKHGYILEPPTVDEVKIAERGMEAAGGWESCDRCNSRFQVFHGRRESDGQLASGGVCQYHWGKAAWPPRSRLISTPSDNDKIFTCCRQKVGQSPGCVTCENHVYKVSEAKRLAAIWQFVETPSIKPFTAEDENMTKLIERAICLDCEMCYTTLGMELIRVTATAFPSGEVVIDALVHPKGGILDLNSRFSGVFNRHIINAQPHLRGPYPPTPQSSNLLINPSSPTLSGDDAEEPLTILPSPEAARSLLLSYLDSGTPIIGHALENDLNALRMCHRAIIDTAILFPHQRGLPLRNKLKWLVEKHLQRRIQIEGDSPQGHDSKIDARCAGELVRLTIREHTAKRKRFESGIVTDANMQVKMKALKRKGQPSDRVTDDKDGGVRLET